MSEVIGFDNDGVIQVALIKEVDSLKRVVHQPSRRAILERNQELRNNPGALNNLESMGLELCIPEEDLIALKQKYPELASRDAIVRNAAWSKFMGSSESDPYRVRPRHVKAIVSQPSIK